MTKTPLRWTDDPRNHASMEAVGDMPASEAIVEAEITDCWRCGNDPKISGRGVIVDGTVVNGVLVGKLLCGDCIDEMAEIHDLEPLD